MYMGVKKGNIDKQVLKAIKEGKLIEFLDKVKKY